MEWAAVNPRRCHCGKRRYATREAALAVVARGSERRRECRAYFAHGWWHLTSKGGGTVRPGTWVRVGDRYRVAVSRDQRSGQLYVRLKRHKRGQCLSFTLAEWNELMLATSRVSMIITTKLTEG